MHSYDKVLMRIAQLIKSSDPEKELKLLTQYQLEQTPNMPYQQAQNCVVFGLIKTYGDYTLDYLWSTYLKEQGSANLQKVA